MSGIKISQESYKLSNGTYINCTVSPRASVALNHIAVAWFDNGNFDNIGFSTSAAVRFAYEVANITTTTFQAWAQGDTDGDGDTVTFLSTQSTGPHVHGTDAADPVAGLDIVPDATPADD